MEQMLQEVLKPVTRNTGREAAGDIRSLTAEVQGLRYREASLRAKNDFLYDLLNGIHEGVGVIDEEENLIFCNPAYATILERNPGEIVGRNIMEFLRGDLSTGMHDSVEQGGTEGALTFHAVIVTPGGVAREIRMMITPRFDSRGNACGSVASIVDVTPRRQNDVAQSETN